MIVIDLWVLFLSLNESTHDDVIVYSRSAPTINPLAASTPRHLTWTWYRDVQIGVNEVRISLSNSLNALADKTTARGKKSELVELNGDT